MDDVEARQDDPPEGEPVEQDVDLDLVADVEDQDRPLAQADDTGEFDAELERAIEQAYPELLHRVETSYFADWHQKRGEEVGLAHEAVVAAIKSLKNQRELPDNMLAYLVTVAKRLAQKDWQKREAIRLAETSQLENVGGEDSVVEPGGERTSEDENDDDVSRLEDHPNVFASISGLPMDAGLLSEIQVVEVVVIHAAIDQLPPRQQQVFRAYLSKGQSSTHRELAEELRITEKNFQMTLARAGEAVCKYMRSKGFDVLDRPDWGDVG